MSELKPCPFCGARPKFKAKISQVSCEPCGYFMREYSQDSLHGEYVSEINARLIARWNHRVPDPSTVAAVREECAKTVERRGAEIAAQGSEAMATIPEAFAIDIASVIRSQT